MSKRTATTCNCGCKKPTEVLTTTQIENQAVLNPENLENRDKILILSKNINNAYMVKVMSTLTVKDLMTAINNPEVAFLLVEMKEPEPEKPGTTTPEEPDTAPGPDTGDNKEPTDPEEPGTEGEGGDTDPTEGEDGAE